MVKITGKGVLEPYSRTIQLAGLVRVSDLPGLIDLPEPYHQNIIAVRENKVLSLNEPVRDEDEILIFVSAMGG